LLKVALHMITLTLQPIKGFYMAYINKDLELVTFDIVSLCLKLV